MIPFENAEFQTKHSDNNAQKVDGHTTDDEKKDDGGESSSKLLAKVVRPPTPGSSRGAASPPRPIIDAASYNNTLVDIEVE
jgi:hypothetical protein